MSSIPTPPHLDHEKGIRTINNRINTATTAVLLFQMIANVAGFT
jgi:hypothetical protein